RFRPEQRAGSGRYAPRCDASLPCGGRSMAEQAQSLEAQLAAGMGAMLTRQEAHIGEFSATWAWWLGQQAQAFRWQAQRWEDFGDRVNVVRGLADVVQGGGDYDTVALSARLADAALERAAQREARAQARPMTYDGTDPGDPDFLGQHAEERFYAEQDP